MTKKTGALSSSKMMKIIEGTTSGAMALWSVMEAVKKPHSRVLLVVNATEDKLEGMDPFSVAGLSHSYLGPGQFGYANGSLLMLWPVQRSCDELAVDKEYRIIFSPGVVKAAEGHCTFYARREVKSWQTEVRAVIDMEHSQLATKCTSAPHATKPLTYLCGIAMGTLRLHPVADWFMAHDQREVHLIDGLGRAAVLDDVQPCERLKHDGKVYDLQISDKKRLRFAEVSL